jgi:hypothetical protein
MEELWPCSDSGLLWTEILRRYKSYSIAAPKKKEKKNKNKNVAR